MELPWTMSTSKAIGRPSTAPSRWTPSSNSRDRRAVSPPPIRGRACRTTFISPDRTPTTAPFLNFFATRRWTGGDSMPRGRSMPLPTPQLSRSSTITNLAARSVVISLISRTRFSSSHPWRLRTLSPAPIPAIQRSRHSRNRVAILALCQPVSQSTILPPRYAPAAHALARNSLVIRYRPARFRPSANTCRSFCRHQATLPSPTTISADSTPASTIPGRATKSMWTCSRTTA